MLSELRNLNLKLCSKQYNQTFILHLIVVPQLSSGWRHNFSTKTRQAGCANEQSVYSPMPMEQTLSMYTKLEKSLKTFFQFYGDGGFSYFDRSKLIILLTTFWWPML
jgi:hypothetical protein